MKIPLSGRLGFGLFAIIDDVDYELIKEYRWRLHISNGLSYARTSIWLKRQNKSRSTFLHRMILGATPGQEIDHTNHNGLDCRRRNLRFCSRSQNQWNRRGGLRARRSGKKWRADIKQFGKTIYLGTFPTRNGAVTAYLRASILRKNNDLRTVYESGAAKEHPNGK